MTKDVPNATRMVWIKGDLSQGLGLRVYDAASGAKIRTVQRLQICLEAGAYVVADLRHDDGSIEHVQVITELAAQKATAPKFTKVDLGKRVEVMPTSGIAYQGTLEDWIMDLNGTRYAHVYPDEERAAGRNGLRREKECDVALLPTFTDANTTCPECKGTGTYNCPFKGEQPCSLGCTP